MSAFSAPIEVIQAALHRIGEEELASLDGDDSAARVANSNYEGIVRSFFARHAWTFARQTLNLTRQADVSLGTFKFAWVWPAEVLNISTVMNNGFRLRAGEYSIQDGRVLTVADYPKGLQILATVRAPEAEWPGDFSEAIVVRMQGLFLEALCDKPQDGRLMKRDADVLMRDAIVRDKRQEPGVNHEFVPLAEAWRYGRSAARAYRG